MKGALGFWTLSALVAGNIIGSGVYLLPSALAKYGSVGLFAWGFTAIGAILLSLVFATLSRLMPETGGPYAYCKSIYGNFIGFIVAYSYWIVMWVGISGISIAFTGYLSYFFTFINQSTWNVFIVSSATIWLLTLVNIIGIKTAGIVQLLTTVLKLLPLFLISIFGIKHIDFTNLMQFNVSNVSTFNAFMSAAALTLWSFIGLESASIPAEHVDKPEKTIPKATILGTLVASITYIISATVVMGTVNNTELLNSSSPYALSANFILGGIGSVLVAFGASVSCFGTLNGWIMLQGQMPYAAAKDKLFPKIFGLTNVKKTPIYGLLISSSLATLLLALNLNKALVDQFTFLISIAVSATLVPYGLTTLGEIILLFKEPMKFSKFNFLRSLIISISAFIYSIWMIYGSGRWILYYTVFFILSGLPVYGWLKYKK